MTAKADNSGNDYTYSRSILENIKRLSNSLLYPNFVVEFIDQGNIDRFKNLSLKSFEVTVKFVAPFMIEELVCKIFEDIKFQTFADLTAIQ